MQKRHGLSSLNVHNEEAEITIKPYVTQLYKDDAVLALFDVNAGQ